MPNGPDVAAELGIAIEKRGSAGIVRLNRPRQLNALNDTMRAAVFDALPGFANDPMIYAMVISSAGSGPFCAGGDIRELVETARTDMPAARRSFAAEYRMNWALECFPKPTVSLINGLVVGSGVGLTHFGTHRVAGPGYRFSMPETAIGLFPDVGVSHILARLPGEIGTYLGLTGDAIGAADAFEIGLVTHCVDPSAFDQITALLADAYPVDALLASHHGDPGTGQLAEAREWIDAAFAGDDLATVCDRLAVLSKKAGAAGDWAARISATLSSRSPTSLAVTLRHLRNCRDRDIRQTLISDYRLACRFLKQPDFTEGVRAMLIDKDKSPSWTPARLTDLTAADVDAYFAVPGGGDLVLPERSEMQRMRALR